MRDKDAFNYGGEAEVEKIGQIKMCFEHRTDGTADGFIHKNLLYLPVQVRSQLDFILTQSK